MSKKKSSKKSDAQKIQEIASNSAIKVQKLINKSNKAMMDFNAKEALKQRDFNKAEASTARDFNHEEAILERDFNSAEALKSREWQERMSNTAHQREVADLRAAGLNPVLSANNGAQSYTSASASAGAASAAPASGTAASAMLDSGSSAFANIMSSMLGSMVNLKSAEMSAKAMRESASKSAAAQRYSADRAAEAAKYNADMQYKIAMDKPASNVYQIADKYFGGSKQEVQDFLKDVQKNPSLIFGGDSASMYHFSLTSKGKILIDRQLDKIGASHTSENRLLYVNGLLFGSWSSAKKLRENANKYQAYYQR